MQQELQRVFGLSHFRKGQADIISSVLSGHDTIAVLPTGGGKSLCYQYPAVALQKLVIVVSPLIALMKDQVESLQKIGLPAGCIHSAQSMEEKRKVFVQMQSGGPFVLYLSPERTQKEGFLHWVKTAPVGLFAIDEAHCVSQWGHDFREEYTQLGVLKELRPQVPVLALTASATPDVLRDIGRQLRLKQPRKHVHGFYRPNLYYQVEECGDEDAKRRFLLQAILQNPEGRVLVYCGTRKGTEEVAALLSAHMTQVGCYHAGLSSQERTQTQEAYGRGDIRILVATNAFGMGIDHPDVRLVVHFQMPANIDSLYQEMGRAGRDGKQSTCLLLYAKKDKGLQAYFIQSSEAPQWVVQLRWRTLENLVDYAEGSECRHAEILTYYQDSQRLERCGHCDSCDPHSPRRIAAPTESVETLLQTEVPRFGIPKKTSKRQAAKQKRDDVTLSAEHQHRYEALRAWRLAKAKELDVAAFMIFSDRTLKEIAKAEPSTLDELGRIYGIGDYKLRRFAGSLFREPLADLFTGSLTELPPEDALHTS